ncbi:SNF2-related protein [Lacticaseibacillus hulanensis]|uniref:SNF2-related protein n=1 Tax=Lacticaseibacillus hulanensis TaxID=2493111 RepID=UPI000FD75787|nr:SNF2-related protein [Lacticaseibacillus hulanensis]
MFSDKVKNAIEPEYTKDLVDNFYNPLLTEANLYQRVSGFFNSASMDLYAHGFEEMVKNGGEAQFVISKEISADDFAKIKEGYSLRHQIRPLNIAAQNEKLNSEAQERLGNLAFMIAAGRARVKVALTKQGLFHDKFGIISNDTECVFFNGSANETQSGISRNYESISVDVSWDRSQFVQSRIKEYKNRFSRLWENREEDIEVIEASDLAYEEIAKYQSLATIKLPQTEDEDNGIQTNEIAFKFIDGSIIRVDNSECKLTSSDRKLKAGSDTSYFFDPDNKTIRQRTAYRDIEKVIQVTKQRAYRKNVKVTVSKAVEQFIARKKYSIEQYKILGEVYKEDLEQFPISKRIQFEEFCNTVQSEVVRPLKPLHLRAAFYEYEMERAANFSVPGAGKTAMLLGVFAYLNSQSAPKNERLERILVVAPISAFESWKHEFEEVFKQKKQLSCIDSQSTKDFKSKLVTDWKVSNLILVNYESLSAYTGVLDRMLDNDTMLVFDEVHRIKNPDGKHAQAALEISDKTKFRYVLTGTPIPNTYRDIYNFLHVLYGDEYNTFFRWDLDELNKPRVREIEEINRSIHPFYWRTNKKDLQVPKADDDYVNVIKPSEGQRKLAEEIYRKEKSSLAILIRLIQASTNPELIHEAINYRELMSYDDDDDDSHTISKNDFEDLLNVGGNALNDSTFNIDSDIVSPKFEYGIDLVCQLVQQNKKVLVWGIFVGTLNKITSRLRAKGIRVNLVYGGTPKSDRVELINEFRDGDIQVLVTNPQTLGESISLQQSVHDAVYFEYNFNLTFMLQSRDRIHRIGLKQSDHTRYYYLQTKDEDASSDRPGYIDEKIYRRLKAKEEIMYGAVDNDKLGIEYSEDEILEAIKMIDEERNRIKLD